MARISWYLIKQDSPGKVLVIRTKELGTDDHAHDCCGTDTASVKISRVTCVGVVKTLAHHRPRLRMQIKVYFVFLDVFRPRTRGRGITTSAKSVAMLRPSTMLMLVTSRGPMSAMRMVASDLLPFKIPTAVKAAVGTQVAVCCRV